MTRPNELGGELNARNGDLYNKHGRRSPIRVLNSPPSSFGVVLALVLGATGTALACPVCFQVEENATTDGVRVAVLVLVGVTTIVLGAFARFVVLFARREGELNRDEQPSVEGQP